MKKIKQKHCRHCGGPIRYDYGEASCLMCSRSKDHRCDMCLFSGEKQAAHAKRRQKKAA